MVKGKQKIFDYAFSEIMKLFDVINVKKKKNVDDTKCCCIAVAAGRGRCGGRTFQTISGLIQKLL